MKTLSRFKKAYLIFLGACIVISAVFLIYVGCVVKDFDRSQPERLVMEKIEWLGAKAADGTLADELNFNKICSNPYEQNDVDRFSLDYTLKIKGAALTYEYAAGLSNDLSKTYNILADGVPIGMLSLAGTNSRSRLFFFNMADWSVKSFTPFLTGTVYNIQLLVPEGTEVLINGIKPADEDLDSTGEVPAYSIKGLLYEPTIEYKRTDGSPLRFTSENNVIKPALYDYELSVPSGIKVSVNGRNISGEPGADGKSSFVILEMEKPEIIFTDILGKTMSYRENENPVFSSCNVSIPESYSLTIDGKAADSLCQPVTAPHPDAELLLKHADVSLPNRKSYALSLIEPGAKVIVSDGSGQQKEFSLTGKALEINSLGGGEIPEDISSKIDVMETAKNWSRFMTDDLPGATHGLYTVYKFFIKDSDYYKYAYQWATGIDITFTSDHTLDSFSNERISGFTRYNDKCFSCEVYFEKNMTLYRDSVFAGKRTDVFNSVMYFVYVDDTPNNGVDDPHWAIAVMHDVV